MLEPRPLTHQEYQTTFLRPLDGIVQEMERTGVTVSVPRFRELSAAAGAAVVDHETKLNAWAEKVGHVGVNFNSWQAVLALFDAAGVPRSPYYRKGAVPDGKASVDDGALDWLISHCPEHRENLLELRYRRRAARIVMYCDKWAGMAVDRGSYATLHPSFGLASDNDSRPGAVTGRFAVKEPALNQVPSNEKKDIFGLKSAFIAPPGEVVVSVDASQLEVVLIADFADRVLGVREMADRLEPGPDGKAKDFHIFTARKIFGEILGDEVALNTPDDEYKKNPYTSRLRGDAKSLRYGIHYLKSGPSFGDSLFDEHGNAIGRERGIALVDAFYQAEGDLKLVHDFGAWWVRRYGVAVSAFGRWRMCDGWDSKKLGEYNRAKRIFANWYPQSTGQEVLVAALIAIHNDKDLWRMGYRVRLPVHDELVGTVPLAHAEEATRIVEHHVAKSVALRARLVACGGFADTWKDAKA